MSGVGNALLENVSPAPGDSQDRERSPAKLLRNRKRRGACLSCGSCCLWPARVINRLADGHSKRVSSLSMETRSMHVSYGGRSKRVSSLSGCFSMEVAMDPARF